MEQLLYLIAASGIELNGLPRVSADSARIQTILTIVFSFTGAVALIIITLAGFKYVLSKGDPQAINQARNAILYALVGLVVSMTAVSIVTFVIGRV